MEKKNRKIFRIFTQLIVTEKSHRREAILTEIATVSVTQSGKRKSTGISYIVCVREIN